MQNDSVPRELDWVNVRAKCNLLEILKLLEDGARTDVENAMKLLPRRSETTFAVFWQQ